MSLDLYIKCGIRNKKGHWIECNVIEHHQGSGVYYRGSGKNYEVNDIEELKKLFPTQDLSQIIKDMEENKDKTYFDSEVWSGNITHNLGAWRGTGMAQHVPLQSGLTLYDILWRPDEHNYDYLTSDYISEVKEGLQYLQNHPEELKIYNPSNGWGNYDVLLNFVGNLYNAIKNLDLDEYDYRIIASR